MNDDQYNDMLLPCPFCGSKAEIMEYSDDYLEYGAICTECSAVRGWGGTKAEAVELWNTRIDADELAAAINEITARAHAVGIIEELRNALARLEGITGDGVEQ